MDFSTKGKKRRYAIVLGIAFCVLFLSGRFWITGYAYEQKMGIVTGNFVNVRKGPSTDYDKVTQVSRGQNVTVTNEDASSGIVWYEVTFSQNGTDYTGWIINTYLSVTGTSEGDASYIESLKAAGFPESYCGYLAALHEKYPNWQFEAVQTGLDWNTVIQKENAAGKNLVQKTVNDARKSVDPACYDWSTNTWYIYDGNSWVGASSDYIAHCMDPRNWLNEKYIFQFETLSYAEYQGETGVRNILSGTFMAGDYADADGVTRNYANSFVEIGKNINVSPYHLASRCKQEQGTKGTSSLISGTYAGYEGYYNYFNIGAYGSGTKAVVESGLKYAKAQGWDTRYKALSGGAEFLANRYVKKGQNTIYFEKFNVVNTAGGLYSHQYMTNVMGAISEGKSMGTAYADKTQAFLFRIPVYLNMPESAVTFTDSGNPNNWLSALTVEGYNLTPTFSGATTTYSFVVDETVSSVTINANPVAATSSVSGTGKYDLAYGINTINVVCKAQNGSERTYTINIARQGTDTSTDTGTNTDTNTDTNTGNSVTYGDVNQDGKISNADIVFLKRHILGLSVLSGEPLTAADVNRDGKVSNADIVKVKRHILGIEQIPNE